MSQSLHYDKAVSISKRATGESSLWDYQYEVTLVWHYRRHMLGARFYCKPMLAVYGTYSSPNIIKSIDY